MIRAKNRAEIQEALGNRGIATGLHYPLPIHLQPAYQELGYNKGDFPITEACADEILSLPIFPELSDDAIDEISGEIRNVIYATAPKALAA